MKKSYLMLAAAAALFAACSNDDGVAEAQNAEQQVAAGEVPVGFDVYVNRGTTRAGQEGELTLSTLINPKVGFGVFAYYTNADSYDQSFTPNFMYNQHLEFNTSAWQWEYSPIKYWPNEFGNTAESDDVDKVSFFAYAPYVSVNVASGKVNGTGSTYTADNGDITMGIVGMKNNSATGDPMVKYISTFYTDKQVDLTWGTASGEDWVKKNTGVKTFESGMPWLNVEHPTKTSTSWGDAQKINFNFKHALASLNVTVDTKANSDDAASPLNEIGSSASATKVFIRSVTFEGFDTKGALNLNNGEANKAFWYNFNCADELNNGNEVTIKDGRKDGKEGLTAATKEYAAINPVFVQSAVWESVSAGVTKDKKNLFCKANGTEPNANEDPIYVIPNADPLKVTIEYDVLTKDDNLAGVLNDGQTKGSVVKNVITRYIKDDSDAKITLTDGKKYTINLHLGLNSVEFSASVTDWTAAGTPDGDADLPHNN